MTQPRPEGWYPDPRQLNSQRYWDGRSWTEETAPWTVEEKQDKLVAAGWIGVLFFAPLAWVVGCVLLGQGRKDEAWPIIAASLVLVVVVLALVSAGVI